MGMRYRMLLIMTVAQVCGAVIQQGFGSLAPFVVSYFHVSKAQLGLSFTAILLGSALTVAAGGIAVDRFGERNITIGTGVAMFFGCCIAAIVPSYPWLVAWLFVVGVTYAAMTPAGGRAILTWFDRDRGFAMSVRQMGVPLGAFVGGLVLPALASRWNYQAALIGGGAFALIGTAGAAFFYQDPVGGPPAHGMAAALDGVRTILRDARAIFYTITCMVLVSSQHVANAFLALTAIQVGHTGIAVAALLFATAQLCAVMGRLVWGWVSDVPFRGDRSLPLAFMCVLVSVAALGLAFSAPGNLALLFASAIAIGFSGSAWNGLFAAAMAEIGGVRFAGSAIGLGLTAVFGTGAVAPFLFGWLADVHGLPAAWMAIAFLSLFGIIPALFARRAFAEAAAFTKASFGGGQGAGG